MAAVSRIGLVTLLAAPAFAALGYYFAWHAGCSFDAKQGIGDVHSAGIYSLWSQLSMGLACAAIAAAVPLIWRRTWPTVFGSILVAVVLAVPLALLVLLAADASGTGSCFK
jgi:hypothetical protein